MEVQEGLWRADRVQKLGATRRDEGLARRGGGAVLAFAGVDAGHGTFTSGGGSPSSTSVVTRRRVSSARARAWRLSAADASSSSSGQSSRPQSSANPSSSVQQPEGGSASNLQKAFKLQVRILTGVILGAAAAVYVFSGTGVFALGLTLMSLLGLSEYFKMAAAKGHVPARRTGYLTTLLMMFVSWVAPALADVVLPVCGALICCYMLLQPGERQATIADVSTTFLGLFYVGYLPSFWVRLHSFQFVGELAAPHNSLSTSLTKILSAVWPRPLTALRPQVHTGAMVVFWTWLAIALADVSAFFIGKAFGRTKLTAVSPKKTVEGAVAGFMCSAAVSVVGARLMQWPMWALSGSLYGVLVGVVALLGDLVQSLFKRDAGMKDSGDIIPGHGGILDRTDSYVFIAPLVYYIVTLLLPLLARAS